MKPFVVFLLLLALALFLAVSFMLATSKTVTTRFVRLEKVQSDLFFSGYVLRT